LLFTAVNTKSFYFTHHVDLLLDLKIQHYQLKYM
jgi:hypothetical protein